MNVRRISAIFRKDLLDAIRDARILVTLLTPLLIGIFYGYVFDDVNIPSASLAVSDPSNSALISHIADSVEGQLDLTIDRFDSGEAVQQRIAEDKASLGLVIPDGFDTAIAAGQQPDLQVLIPQNPGIGGQFLLATLDPILRSMANQQLPANVQTSTIPLDTANLTIIDKMSLRTWSIVFSLLMMVSMVALMAVPIILAEESEKKTIDALVMVSSYGEVVVAKALLGLSYVALMTSILLALTRLTPIANGWFVVSMAILAICLLGFGLLLGSVFKSATQLNTWVGLLLAPALIPAALLGMGISRLLDRIVSLLPTGAGMRLLTDSFTDPAVYGNHLESVAVLIVWSVIFYGLLLWQLSRRRA